MVLKKGATSVAMACYLNQAHAFVDGNKRTAMTGALVFVNENGWTLDSHANRKTL